MRKKLLIILGLAIAVAVIATLVIRFSKEDGEQIGIPPPPEIPLPTAETDIKRGALTPEKEKIRQELIAPLRGGAGVITNGPDYRISYLPAGPVFQIEIKTVYISRAKDGAIQFFKRKGFSEQDICNLPVAFYLGPEPFKELEGSGVVVKPKPDFCP